MHYADTVLINARIWTGDAALPWTEAVAVKDGHIAALGCSAEIQKHIGPATLLLDAAGRLALPGFIDSHTHLLWGGFQLLRPDLRPAANQAEFAGMLADAARKLLPGQWLIGGNWDHQQWPSGQLPTKSVIDPATPDTPVFVTRLDWHMGLANTAALELAGIDRFTPDPPGGSIVRDETGQPTGILKDAAMDLIWRIVPEPDHQQRLDALGKALEHAAACGVTSVHDSSSWEDWLTFTAYYRQHGPGLRIYARTPLGEWEKQRDWLAANGPGDHWLRLGGVKGFLDGSLGSSTALFFEPYSDAPETAGLLVQPPETMAERIAAADLAGLQPSIHAIGDRANHLLLDMFAAVAAANGPRDRRCRTEHAQHLIPGDINRLASLGVIASVQPYHAVDDARWIDARIGPHRSEQAYPFRSLLDAGVAVAFGTDWPVAPLSPLLSIHAAVNRQPIDGQLPGGWQPQQRVTVEEAVRCYTATGAYAEYAETAKGRLAAGLLADLVVLSQDIFTIAPGDIAATRVLCTMCGGKIVHRHNDI